MYIWGLLCLYYWTIDQHCTYAYMINSFLSYTLYHVTFLKTWNHNNSKRHRLGHFERMCVWLFDALWPWHASTCPWGLWYSPPTSGGTPPYSPSAPHIAGRSATGCHWSTKIPKKDWSFTSFTKYSHFTYLTLMYKRQLT